jgi:glycerol-3-phosphate dehydrogenase
MEREVALLDDDRFDLLVIGGGIYGAWVAYDAALAGLRVAIVEREDWGSGTSSGSSKLVHGGLRYLATGGMALVRTSLAERERLVRLGPHRVRPLRFVIPTWAGDRPGRLKLRAGLWLYRRLGGGPVPGGGAPAISRHAMLERYPFLREDRLRGGFAYGDCVTDDARLTLEIVDGASANGAVAVNRVRANALLLDRGRVRGAEVVDEETGRRIRVRADVTALCAGPWSPALVEAAGVSGLARPRVTKGVHLLLPGLETEDAFLVPTRDERVVFFIPWYGRTLVGTTDTDYTAAPDDVRVERDDVRYLLQEAGRALRSSWAPTDVVASFAALRTMRPSGAAAPSEVGRDFALEEPIERLLVPVGGKLTSARHDAAITVDRALARLGRPRREHPTEDRAFPWSPDADWETWVQETFGDALSAGLDEGTAEKCLERYGRKVDHVLALVRRVPHLARRIVPDAPFCVGELLHAVRHEMARTLEDVLRRRIPLLLVAPPGRAELREIAEVVGTELGWSPERRAREIEALSSTAAPLDRPAVRQG